MSAEKFGELLADAAFGVPLDVGEYLANLPENINNEQERKAVGDIIGELATQMRKSLDDKNEEIKKLIS